MQHLAVADVQIGVGVGVIGEVDGDEPLPLDGAHRRQHAGVGDVAARELELHHQLSLAQASGHSPKWRSTSP